MYGVEVQFVQSLQRAGGLPFLAPHSPLDTDPASVIESFHGLLLIGGEDLAAEVSGVPTGDVGANAYAERDRWEIRLLGAALQCGLPVLAICRGMQLLNVALGGTLHGDIAGAYPDHPPVPDDLDQAYAYRHRVAFESDTLVSRAYRGTCAKQTNSLHHQAIDRLGSGLIVSARSTDGIIEAVELPDATWCLGVQWHPELLPTDAREAGLFAEFIRACAR